MYPKSLQKLIDIFSKFPGIGQRTAIRFAFYIIKKDKKEIEEIAKVFLEVKNKIKFCKFCFKSFEGEKDFCEICSDPKRDKSLLCIVEKEMDLEAIEKTKKYKGLYFILGGPISSIKREEVKKLKIEELKERIKENPQIKEIIIATNATTEGEAISLLIERKIKDFNKKITKLARGLPVGGELEYADEDTLEAALEGRK